MADMVKELVPENIRNMLPDSVAQRAMAAGAVFVGTRWLCHKISDLRYVRVMR